MEGIDPKLRGKLNKMYFKTTTSGDHAWASSENTGISTTNPVQVKALKKALVIPMSLFLLKFLKGKKNGKRVVARGRKVGGAAKLSRQMWEVDIHQENYGGNVHEGREMERLGNDFTARLMSG